MARPLKTGKQTVALAPGELRVSNLRNDHPYCAAWLQAGSEAGFAQSDDFNGDFITDLGLDVTTLPGSYGLTAAAWKHWCNVWEVDYDWLQSRFDEPKLVMEWSLRTTSQVSFFSADRKSARVSTARD